MTGHRRKDHLRPASGPEAGRISLQIPKPCMDKEVET